MMRQDDSRVTQVAREVGVMILQAALYAALLGGVIGCPLLLSM